LVGIQVDPGPVGYARNAGVPRRLGTGLSDRRIVGLPRAFEWTTPEHRVDSSAEATALVWTDRALALPGAIVPTQSVPEPQSFDAGLLETALATAFTKAKAENVRGKPLTPFLLDAIRSATNGDGLRANCALLIANAALEADVAVERLTRPGDARQLCSKIRAMAAEQTRKRQR
jgi:hypothetical protein